VAEALLAIELDKELEFFVPDAALVEAAVVELF
jgi:hypothetical protein